MRLCVRLLVLLLALSFASCSSHKDEDYSPIAISNNPQPRNVDSLRVLAIGNSFTLDGVRYLNYIIDSARIDQQKVCIYVANRPKYSLMQWGDVCYKEEKIQISREVGQLPMNDFGSLPELFAQDWDIIVFQQYSRQSDRFTTFNPPLADLVTIAIRECKNPDVCIAWQLTWNYWDNPKEYPKSRERYFDIVNAAQEMMDKNGIDVIIPSGTAIENARNCKSIRSDYGLTRDGTHLSFGTGCYIASCTWFQTLFKPAFGIDITATTFDWQLEDWELADTKYDAFNVDASNCLLCQKCALAALSSPFAISEIK